LVEEFLRHFGDPDRVDVGRDGSFPEPPERSHWPFLAPLNHPFRAMTRPRVGGKPRSL
jgi:hypothetical protein